MLSIFLFLGFSSMGIFTHSSKNGAISGVYLCYGTSLRMIFFRLKPCTGAFGGVVKQDIMSKFWAIVTSFVTSFGPKWPKIGHRKPKDLLAA